jgi:hypothetical protein
MYRGHPVPYIPTDLGYYDLRERETRQRQGEMARGYGIFGFCYYFYWFGGKRLLERPLELMLSDGQPDIPYCLCWANEPWSRRWDGREQDVLMSQAHDHTRDLAILDDLMPYLEDARYIRIGGRPLLLIYRQGLLDDPVRLTAALRDEARRRGLPGLFLCNVMSIGDQEKLADGFDAAIEFPPNGLLVTDLEPKSLDADPAFRGRIYDYGSTIESNLARPNPSFVHFPGVMPRWDNSARRGMAAQIFHGSNPALFERWLRRAALVTSQRNPEAPLVFVNSWNEWAEGAHLEPDTGVGSGYLEAVARVVLAPAGDLSEHDQPSTTQAVVPSVGQAPIVTLVPGMPPHTRPLDVHTTAGSGWLDSVDGTPLAGHVVSAVRGEVLRLQGWFYGSPRRAHPRGIGYFILSSGDAAWHAPVHDRHRRPDLRRPLLARDRRSRRLVRSIDRLPAAIGRRILRLLVGRGDQVGFDVCVRLDSIERGSYRIGFAETTASSLQLVGTEFVMRIG